MSREEILGREALIRLECAALAHGDPDGARRILDFVSGADARSPLEKIADALKDAGVRSPS